MVTTFQVDDDLAGQFRVAVRNYSNRKIKEEMRTALENRIAEMKKQHENTIGGVVII